MNNYPTVTYDVVKDSWYSPQEILKRFNDLRNEYGSLVNNHEFKKAREMFAGAVALLGAYELSDENRYWMQLNTQSASPDIMTAMQVEQEKGGILLMLQQLEIVEFEAHSTTDDIYEFLYNTKLSSKKAYSEYMLIVCIVNKNITLNHEDLHKKFNKLRPKSTIYVLGRPEKNDIDTFSFFTPYPDPTRPVTFNVMTTGKKFFLPERIQFSFENENKIKYTKMELKPVTTYDIFGLNRDKIYKKYRRNENL